MNILVSFMIGLLKIWVRPQMGLLSRVLGSRDFNGWQDEVAALQDGVVMVYPVKFYQKIS